MNTLNMFENPQVNTEIPTLPEHRGGRITRRRGLAALTADALGAAGAGSAALMGCGPIGQQAAGQPAARRAPVTLTVWNHIQYSAELDKGLFPPAYKRFQEQTGHTIDETVYNPEAQIPEKLTAALAGGTPPEVSFVHPQWLASSASKKMIVPIDDRVKKDTSIKLADSYSGTIAYYQFPIGGKQYGLPFYSGPSMCLFNRSLSKQLGVKAPDELEREGKWTWDGARDFVVQATRQVGGQKVWGWEGITEGLHFLNIIVWGYGGEYWDKDFTKAQIGEAATVEALQLYADFQARHNAVPTGDDERSLPTSARGPIISGRIAAKYGIRGAVPEFATWAEQNNIEIGMAPMPKGPKGRFVRNGPNGFTIPVGTKHPDAAYDLLSYTVGDEFQALNLPIGGSTPPRKSQADTLFAKHLRKWENLSMWKEAMEQDKPLPVAATHSDIQSLFTAEYRKVKAGAQTMRQAADILMPQINDLLKQAKALHG